MQNETKNEKTINQEFLQAEPVELDEATLLSLSGGVYDRKQGATRTCDPTG